MLSQTIHKLTIRVSCYFVVFAILWLMAGNDPVLAE